MQSLRLDLKIAKDTPYFILMGELWGIYCVYSVQNWSYKGPYSKMNN